MSTKFDTQSFKDAMEGKDPVLVDFYADWCPPCKVIAPTVDAVAEAFEGRAIVGKLDVDADPDVASAYDVRNIPTILVLVGGEVVARFVGVVGEAELSNALDEALLKVVA